MVVNKSTPPTGGKFKKGTSGNPSGRPLGSRNKATLLAEQLLDGEAEQLVQQVVNLAKKGDIQALRMCLERLIPIRKERSIELELPPARSMAEMAASYQSILAGVGEGRITPGEAQALSETLTNHARLLEAVDWERRLEQLEAFKSQIEEYRREQWTAVERFTDENKNEQSA